MSQEARPARAAHRVLFAYASARTCNAGLPSTPALWRSQSGVMLPVVGERQGEAA
jgi:hypothetical protein